MSLRILLVDDDPSVLYTLQAVFADEAYETQSANDGAQALALFQENPYDLVITDLSMPNMDGIALLQHIHAQAPTTPVIMITAHGSERKAVEAMKQGAWDYLSKPFDIDELALTVEKAAATLSLHLENDALRAQRALSRPIIYKSTAMHRLMTLTHRAAKRNITVLISGDTGTGKDLIASALHELSARADKPFICFNTAALPENLAESHLFGHEKGAFTGATHKHNGLFSQADGGVLFLDEIGELSTSLQAKLLRVLQHGEFLPLGASQTQKADVRVIAATHRDLHAEVAAGNFRQDLYYRLNVVQLHIPPLSKRPEDITPLLQHFLAKNKERFDLPDLSISSQVLIHLVHRPWPGNVRELENAIERLVALSDGETITESDLSLLEHPQHLTGQAAFDPTVPLRKRIAAFESSIIQEALERNQHNQSATARELQISRGTLLDKMARYKLR